MGARVNLVGQKFGRLTVIELGMTQSWGRRMWVCMCECGSVTNVVTQSLKSGNTKSCGCYNREVVVGLKTTHGHAGSPEYVSWASMKNRCNNKKGNRYADWGGRGIRVCDRWNGSFENFLEDMGERPSIEHTIDRYPDVNGNYEPDNCRWATPKQQNRNKRSNKWISYDSTTMIVEDWASKLNISPITIRRHLKSGKPFSWIYNRFKPEHA